jgi:hypothetical protein
LALKHAYPGALALLVSLLVCACEKEDRPRQLTIERVHYVFPEDTVAGYYDDKKGTDDYIRVDTPSRYQVIYSLRAFRTNQQGKDVPTITHINDDPGSGAAVIRTQSGLVIKTPKKLRLDCGMRIIDEGVVWSVLFDCEDVTNVNSIVAEAGAFLVNARRSVR